MMGDRRELYVGKARIDFGRARIDFGLAPSGHRARPIRAVMSVRGLWNFNLDQCRSLQLA
jgi:hypothetical protein